MQKPPGWGIFFFLRSVLQWIQSKTATPKTINSRSKGGRFYGRLEKNKERILEHFPGGILNIGSLQGRKLDFENVEKLPQNELQLSDEELSKKAEELAARESELKKREAAIAEKEAYIKQLEEEMVEKTRKLQSCLDESKEQHIEGGETH